MFAVQEPADVVLSQVLAADGQHSGVDAARAATATIPRHHGKDPRPAVACA